MSFFFKSLKFRKGMTLMEILVSISLLAFMFIFIVQVVQQNHRQSRKIIKKSRKNRAHSHALEIMRQDFRGVSYFVDMKQNLELNFPILDEESDREEFVDSTRKTVVFSEEYLFEASESFIEFSSYSFVDRFNKELSPSGQWMRIYYSIEPCRSLEIFSEGLCLIRSSSLYWSLETKREEERKLILLKGFQSLQFFYADSQREWKKNWKVEKVESRVLQIPFPMAVKIEGQQEGKERSFLFSVSSSYLKTWNHVETGFLNFPIRKVSKRKKPIR